jgi:hypothetical protein
MAETFLTLTNKVITEINEVELTSANFSTARGVQVQCKNAVNDSIRWINQKEYTFPFNHSTATKTLTAGVVRYSVPTSTKLIDYNTVRIVKDSTLSNSGYRLTEMNYNDYLQKYSDQEDEIETTTLDGTHTDSVETITVASTTGFDSAGTLYIGNEIITYTGTSSTTFTGATREASGTTASAYSSGVTVAQFDRGGVPTNIIRTPDNNYLLFPFPNKSYNIKFDYYTYPDDLVDHDDTTTIPDRFNDVITTGATAFVFQFRGETNQYELNMKRFEQGIKNMQSLLANRFDYLKSTYIQRDNRTNARVI